MSTDPDPYIRGRYASDVRHDPTLGVGQVEGRTVPEPRTERYDTVARFP